MEEGADKASAIEKALIILNEFTKPPYAYTARELSDCLGFSKPTVHRTLNILENFHYIRRTYDGEYSIGYKAYHVGMIYANHTDVFLEIRKVVDEMAKVTCEQVGYAVLEGTDAVSIYESQMQDTRIRYIAGSIYPVNSGCYGKVLMAFSHSKEELPAIVAGLKLEQVSLGAIMDKTELIKAYYNIMEAGYADSLDEFLDGTVGLGVPVFLENGKLHGCMALGAIKSSSFDAHKAEYLKILREGAKRLGHYLLL